MVGKHEKFKNDGKKWEEGNSKFLAVVKNFIYKKFHNFGKVRGYVNK